MATLKDLSRHLGLSVTQVSRALNGHSDVNEQTRARVQEAAKILKYQPNISARRLVTGRSGTVGLVVPPPVSTDGHAVFVEMISGLSASFAQQNVHFLLHVVNPQEDPVAVHRRLIDSANCACGRATARRCDSASGPTCPAVKVPDETIPP